MADLLKVTEDIAYIKMRMPRRTFEALVQRFGGEMNYALRELRLRWEGVIASLDAGNLERAPSRPEPPPMSRLNAYAKASRGE